MAKEKRDDTATLTAQAHNVTAAYVRMVVNGTRKNRTDILTTYNNIIQMKENLSKQTEEVA